MTDETDEVAVLERKRADLTEAMRSSWNELFHRSRIPLAERLALHEHIRECMDELLANARRLYELRGDDI